MSALRAVSSEPETVGLINVEAEALLLAALLGNNEHVDRIADLIRPDDFGEHIHARIYDTILTLTAAGKQASAVTLIPHLDNDPAFDDVNGAASYLAALSGSSVFAVRPRDLADQVADLAARRRLLVALDEAKAGANDLSTPLTSLVDASDAALVAAVERREAMRQMSLTDAIGEAIARIETIQANDGKVGATTGIYELDHLLVGLEPAQLVVIAGRPGMGKTAVASSMALGLGRAGHGVQIASLEMRGNELGMRMLSDLCFRPQAVRRIEFSRIVDANVDPDEMRTLIRAKDAIADWPIGIDDTGGVTLSRLLLSTRRAKRRMAAKGQTLKVLIVDYLQLVQPDNPRKSQYEAVSEVSKGLKLLAKELDITVVALAQLSRAVEQRENKRPQLSDLRDSGQIEQDADAVMFLYRDEYYLAQHKPKAGYEADHQAALDNSAGKLDLILAKRRNGRIGSATVQFLTHYQAIRSYRDDRR